MRVLPDKSFMYLNKKDRFTNPQFKEGLQYFFKYAARNPRGFNDGRIFCPCKKYGNHYPLRPEVVEEHVYLNGFELAYRSWTYHGEGVPDETGNTGRNVVPVNLDLHPPVMVDDTHQMLDDILAAEGFQAGDPLADTRGLQELQKLIEENEKDLYPGCTEFSRLSFLIKLFHIKKLGGIANKYFDMLLDLLRRVIPNGEASIPKNHSEASKLIKTLGFTYEKIHACPNDCILYRKDFEMLDACPTCGVSRWEKDKRTSVNDSAKTNRRKKEVPAKVLRYFPLTKRLQIFFIAKDIAKDMRWHFDLRIKDGKLRHPADTEAWKQLDSIEHFGDEKRNVRLGLASDGFNPYGTMSASYSTWPVLLMPYNLPPSMCMKQPNIILSLLIPGRYSPGQNIDVYLQPLIEELQDLWKVGVLTYDAYTEEKFKMRAAILWTINDFPVYGMLSRWSVYAAHACPVCGLDYSGQKLHTRGKYCYWFHRRWLPLSHPFRKQAKNFDGTVESRIKPKQLTGDEIFEQQSTLQNIFGSNRFDEDGVLNKLSKRKRSTPNMHSNGWKKKSIFFDLPYWRHLKIRHNIDVMHVEKNICDNILSTLLQDQNKSKENLNARIDLRELGIRQELHPIDVGNNVFEMGASSHTMTNQAMKNFCEVLKNIKMPDGYSSNISKNVQVDERKISSLKTHDCHVLFHQLLSVALRNNLPCDVTKPLIEFSGFFNKLCSKVIDVAEFVELEKNIVETLCKLEKIFPPYFFTLMVHLSVHLATEARIAGPVSYRWMYPVERYLGFLKNQTRNRARPEGSIAESYIAHECLNFASRYLRGVETRMNRAPRITNDKLSCPKGEDRAYQRNWLEQTHMYILTNLTILEEYRSLHVDKLKSEIQGRNASWKIDQENRKRFSSWFHRYIDDGISKGVKFDDTIISISKGPSPRVMKYNSYCINNIKFHTNEIEANRVTQNNGVYCPFEQNFYSSSRDQNPVEGEKFFYGQLEDIIELFYGFKEQVRFIMFKVRWCACQAKDEYGFQIVNLSKEIYRDDKFMLASQAEQCFYVKVNGRDDMWIALKKPPRTLFESPNDEADEDEVEDNDCPPTTQFQPNFNYVQHLDNLDCNITTSATTSSKGKEKAT